MPYEDIDTDVSDLVAPMLEALDKMLEAFSKYADTGVERLTAFVEKASQVNASPEAVALGVAAIIDTIPAGGVAELESHQLTDLTKGDDNSIHINVRNPSATSAIDVGGFEFMKTGTSQIRAANQFQIKLGAMLGSAFKEEVASILNNEDLSQIIHSLGQILDSGE